MQPTIDTERKAGVFDASNLVNEIYLSAERLELMIREQGEEMFDNILPDGNGSDAQLAKMKILHNFGRAAIRHRIAYDYCLKMRQHIDELDKLLNRIMSESTGCLHETGNADD